MPKLLDSTLFDKEASRTNEKIQQRNLASAPAKAIMTTVEGEKEKVELPEI